MQFTCPWCNEKSSTLREELKPLENIRRTIELDDDGEIIDYDYTAPRLESLLFECPCGFKSTSIDTFIKEAET